MSPGRESYYEREVARGVEDYMAEHGEAKGWWAGAGAAAAGLTGEIAEGALSELFGHGRHPVTGQVLGHTLPRGVPFRALAVAVGTQVRFGAVGPRPRRCQRSGAGRS